MFAIFAVFGNIDYATVFSLAPFISENIITIIGICLLIGAMAKSSQFGLVKALNKFLNVGDNNNKIFKLSSTKYKNEINRVIYYKFGKMNNKSSIYEIQKNYSTLAITKENKVITEINFHPYYVTGFAEGEATFHIRISPTSSTKIG
jgi:polyferredoxin